jgi:hypothetical protein
MADEVIYKRPDEIYSYSYDFTPKLPLDSGLTASSAVTAVDEEGTAAPAVVGTKAISGVILTCPLIAGTNGKDYTITFKGIGATSADSREWVVEMRVRSKIGGTL